MGSFSWLKADDLTQISNVHEGCKFKFLIPAEFGGGFIKDTYQDYGYLGTKENGEPRYDMYELLAFWNSDQVDNRITNNDKDKLTHALKYDSQDKPLMKEIDDNTDHNRSLGIDIGCYDNQIDKLRYPLKLVSASFKGNYEDVARPSYNDPHQGFYPTYRSEETKSSEDRKEDNSSMGVIWD